jgi:hypothetical protein
MMQFDYCASIMTDRLTLAYAYFLACFWGWLELLLELVDDTVIGAW